MELLKRNAARIVLLVLAVILMALTVFCPSVVEERVELHDGEDIGLVLQAGESLTIPVETAGSLNALSLRMKNVKEAKGITLTLSLEQNGQEIAANEVDLKKARPRSWATVELAKPTALQGATLTVTASGEGSVTVSAAEEATGTMPLLRLTMQREVRAVAPAAVGALMMLLALVPSGKEARHA